MAQDTDRGSRRWFTKASAVTPSVLALWLSGSVSAQGTPTDGDGEQEFSQPLLYGDEFR